MKAMKVIEKFKKLKRYSDKHQFTLRFKVLDAPTTAAEKIIAVFYPGAGWKKYIRMLFGKRYDYIRFRVEKHRTKRDEVQIAVFVEGHVQGISFSELIANVSPGQLNVITLTFGMSIHIRINNRVMVKDVDLSHISDGYRIYELSDFTTDDGWLIKLL